MASRAPNAKGITTHVMNAVRSNDDCGWEVKEFNPKEEDEQVPSDLLEPSECDMLLERIRALVRECQQLCNKMHNLQSCDIATLKPFPEKEEDTNKTLAPTQLCTYILNPKT